jgi:hypothetical protein
MKEYKSLFTRGVNSDFDKSVTPNESYLSGFNLTLTGEGKFLALENIKGTEELNELISSFSGYVLGVYANKYKIGSTLDVDCLTIFTAQSGGDFKIICYDLENDTQYEIFSQPFTAEFEARNPLIDLIVYPEGGIDINYFTDNYNELRKFRCEIPVSYSPNFLTAEQISLQRRGTLAEVIFDQVSTDGELLSGTYQFVMRFFNEDTRSYSKWTIPTTPVIVSRTVSGAPQQGGYGVTSGKKIELQVSVPTYELVNWTHYQLAVFENIQPANVVDASLQKIEELTGGTVSGEYTLFDYEYKENVKIGTVALVDIVVDLAAIRRLKTLSVKNNKLFGANIEYWNRDYDNGDPVVTGSVIDFTSTNLLTSDTELSKYKGYFRDEVYRYYISHFDEHFNYSRPRHLDLSGIPTYGLTNGDIKFPTRKAAGFTLMNSSSHPRTIGLELSINNHPSWAKGFVILRAERKKRIKFQTPFIPSSLIEGIEVIGEYPTLSFDRGVSGGFIETPHPNAEPMNPLGTLMPKNFLHTVRKNIKRVPADIDPGVNAYNLTQKGEARYTAAETSTKSNSIYFGYPPSVWGGEYSFTTGDGYEVQDFAFLKLNNQRYDDGTFEAGDQLVTSYHGSMYATSIQDYYYGNAGRSNPSLPTMEGELLSFKQLANVGEGTNVANYSIEEFDNLETTTIFYNPPPNTQAAGVFELKIPRQDETLYAHSSYGGSQLTTSGGGTIEDGLFEINEDQQTNKFASEKAGYAAGEYISLVPIVNIVNDLGDDRYGDSDTIHNVIFTGSSHIFSESELTQIAIDGQVTVVKEVWGGDVFVNFQQVKLTDSHYGLVNAQKQGPAPDDLLDYENGERWIRLFHNKWNNPTDNSGDIISMPVPYANMSQVLSVMVESEVLTNITDPQPYGDYITSDNKQVATAGTDDEFKLRVPFSYGYNINYSKSSNQKAFIPFNPNENVVTKYPSRVIVSDQKVYQTDLLGFDIFRVSNFVDLEETYGGVTKLTLSGNDLIALQEKAVVYLPVDIQIAETADGDTLSIRSSTVVDIPRYISRQYGTSLIKSVSQIDSSIFFADSNNKVVVKFDKGLNLISETGMIGEMDSMLTDVNEIDIYSLYDNKRRQYWLWSKASQKCWIWDDRLKCWVSNYEFDSLQGGVYTKDEVHLTALNTNLNLYRMYTGDYNNLAGTIVTPRVTLSINPEYDYPKTFDDIVAFSSGLLATADMETETDSGQGQTVNGMVFAIKREGNYRIPTLRDGGGARLRGERAIATFKWRTDNEKVSLSQVITKFRTSERKI